MAYLRSALLFLVLCASFVVIKAGENEPVMVESMPEAIEFEMVEQELPTEVTYVEDSELLLVNAPPVEVDQSDAVYEMAPIEEAMVSSPEVVESDVAERATVNVEEGKEVLELAELFWKGMNPPPRTTCKTRRTTYRTTYRTTHRTTYGTTRRTTCGTTRRTTYGTTRRTTCRTTRKTTRRCAHCGKAFVAKKRTTCDEVVKKQIAPLCGGGDKIKFVGKSVGDSCVETCQYLYYEKKWLGSIMYGQTYYYQCAKYW